MIPIQKNKFSSNLETLIGQLSNYECEFNPSKEANYSYLKGAKFIMDNLMELYSNAKNSFMGGLKISALNSTVNGQILKEYFLELKNDLKINYKLSNGGKLDIIASKKIIDNLESKYEKAKLIPKAFIFGAKKMAKIIKYAYDAPLTKPFKEYINSNSRQISKNISDKMNEMHSLIF